MRRLKITDNSSAKHELSPLQTRSKISKARGIARSVSDESFWKVVGILPKEAQDLLSASVIANIATNYEKSKSLS